MNFKHLFTVIGLLFAFTMNAQNNAVLSGTVKTDQGKLVKGATIIIVGSAIKTTSNEEGNLPLKISFLKSTAYRLHLKIIFL